MAPEDKSVRFAGRAVIGVPGSRSALNRTVEFVTPGGVGIRIPDLASALSLKGAAHQLPGINPARHLQDAVTLFACADTTVLALSTSMRRNVNHLISALDTSQAWAAADPSSPASCGRCGPSVDPAGLGHPQLRAAPATRDGQGLTEAHGLMELVGGMVGRQVTTISPVPPKPQEAVRASAGPAQAAGRKPVALGCA